MVGSSHDKFEKVVVSFLNSKDGGNIYLGDDDFSNWMVGYLDMQPLSSAQLIRLYVRCEPSHRVVFSCDNVVTLSKIYLIQPIFMLK